MLRFNFGVNWKNYLSVLDERRIAEAEKCLADMLDCDLHGKSFLDIGSGSGLMSLAARRMGAIVHSFDYSSESVDCARELKHRFFPEDANWHIERGDILDPAFLSTLSRYDVVYAWGVLHHTGDMWQALANVSPLVAPGGSLFIAIYNDQGGASRRWTTLKRLYNQAPTPVRRLMEGYAFLRLWTWTFVRDTLAGTPLKSWNAYYRSRGMSAWHDVVDWIGGYPFEVATPERIFDFFRQKGYRLERLTTCIGSGCNQYVFSRP